MPHQKIFKRQAQISVNGNLKSDTHLKMPTQIQYILKMFLILHMNVTLLWGKQLTCLTFNNKSLCSFCLFLLFLPSGPFLCLLRLLHLFWNCCKMRKWCMDAQLFKSQFNVLRSKSVFCSNIKSRMLYLQVKLNFVFTHGFCTFKSMPWIILEIFLVLICIDIGQEIINQF